MREICARRARKLRRRGVHVTFVRWSPRGKCRYAWQRASAPVRGWMGDRSGTPFGPSD